MITAGPHSDTQRKVYALTKRVKQLETERAAERELVAAARELVEAEREADRMALRCYEDGPTGTVARRLEIMDRLARAQRRMRGLFSQNWTEAKGGNDA